MDKRPVERRPGSFFQSERRMTFRSILLGAAVLPLLAGGASAASVPMPPLGIPRGEAPILYVQAGDPRVVSLEEQVRQLNGKVEELNFLIIQLQEQLRRMQEDTEFRFQEIEQRSDAGTSRTTDSAAAPPASSDTAAAAVPPTSPDASASSDLPGVSVGGSETLGAPPRNFGTITFDENGNLIGGAAPAPGAPADMPGGATGPDDTTVAALPRTEDPEELYRNAYEFILSGDYGTAEAGFRDHIQRFPDDQRTSDARFWLGEALLGQGRHRDAAEVFLDASRTYPDARKAPDMLLKLGVSLAGINQREVACATFDQVAQRYPSASDALKERVRQERALAAC